MVEGWRNGLREATNSKPLFVTIYATVIIGVLVSSFYVFSAIYSPTNGSTSWLSSPPLSSNLSFFLSIHGWRNGLREATNSKPLFVTIYATVIIGVLVSSFYVFSAIYSPTNGSTSWLSSPPLSNKLCLSSKKLKVFFFLVHYVQCINEFLFVAAGRISQSPQENATFQTPVVPPPPRELPLPSPEEAQGKSLGKIWVSPPRDKKMPPLESFKLTKELFGERVKDNVIIVTFGNYAFMDFILTWVKHLTDLDISNLLVGEGKYEENLYFWVDWSRAKKFGVE
ncbi:hypothetical protein F2Q69_00011196 [Brassica cretica]|uniref:Uncharacterized protein n=1 Tax=Brassica cretica TaxID=69181 RepID=A0A8S9R5P8_BRACR|nr:hypothetical protein F2Q69_00011196 [Brassica cretica]